MKPVITQLDLVEVLTYVFDIQEQLDEASDLSLYIKDSIDLGEFLAVVKNKYGIEPARKELFRKYTTLKDVLAVVNNEITE